MKRKCAVCGDTHQTNVIFKWQRLSDNVVFHVCARCAEEPGKVTADNVKVLVNKTYTTVDSDYSKNTSDGILRKRPTMSDYYREHSVLCKSVVRGRGYIRKEVAENIK